MTTPITYCPLWGQEFKAEGYFDEATLTFHVDNSPRAGGGYIISQVELNAKHSLLDESSKARITTWMMQQRKQGDSQPLLNADRIDHAIAAPRLEVGERAEHMLHFLAQESQTVGQVVSVSRNSKEYWMALARTESVTWEEVHYLFRFLQETGRIQQLNSVGYSLKGMVEVKGYERLSKMSAHVDSSQAFVAMWFDPETNDAYDQGIEPAIKEAGFKALRIDHKLDVEKIDDAIIAEIRRSRFLVADFTHGAKGIRGGVYFEAGFAMGLGIPVFFTCRSDMVTSLHFDTRQYAHIVWSTPESLRYALRDRILARIGAGPNGDINMPLMERPDREPFGKWLVNNIPRDTNLEPPPRDDFGRPNPFLDETSQ